MIFFEKEDQTELWFVNLLSFGEEEQFPFVSTKRCERCWQIIHMMKKRRFKSRTALWSSQEKNQLARDRNWR
jgi:hypothetical protein